MYKKQSNQHIENASLYSRSQNRRLAMLGGSATFSLANSHKNHATGGFSAHSPSGSMADSGVIDTFQNVLGLLDQFLPLHSRIWVAFRFDGIRL
jgi:hypothetical protein